MMLLRFRPASHFQPAVPRGSRRGGSGNSAAFTLLEVMIASGIFFVGIFAILGLVSITLRNALALQRPQIDAGIVAAQYVSTNRFSEGDMSGDFDADALKDYSWETQTTQAGSNGLLQAECFLHRRGASGSESISILVFDPNFQTTPGVGPRPMPR